MTTDRWVQPVMTAGTMHRAPVGHHDSEEGRVGEDGTRISEVFTRSGAICPPVNVRSVARDRLLQ